MKHKDPNTIGKSGLSVVVRNNDVDGAMRVLKKRLTQEGVLRDMKRTEAFETGTEARRRRAAEARKRWLKKKALLDRF
jgi:small subunit ribosomal protein S21